MAAWTNDSSTQPHSIAARLPQRHFTGTSAVAKNICSGEAAADGRMIMTISAMAGVISGSTMTPAGTAREAPSEDSDDDSIVSRTFAVEDFVLMGLDPFSDPPTSSASELRPLPGLNSEIATC